MVGKSFPTSKRLCNFTQKEAQFRTCLPVAKGSIHPTHYPMETSEAAELACPLLTVLGMRVGLHELASFSIQSDWLTNRDLWLWLALSSQGVIIKLANWRASVGLHVPLPPLLFALWLLHLVGRKWRSCNAFSYLASLAICSRGWIV